MNNPGAPRRCLPGRAPRFLLPPPLPPPASALTPVMCCLFPDKSQLAAPAPKHSGFGSGLSSAAPLETGSLQFIPRKLRLRQQLLGVGLGGLCQAWVRRDFPTPQGEQELLLLPLSLPLCPSQQPCRWIRLRARAPGLSFVLPPLLPCHWLGWKEAPGLEKEIQEGKLRTWRKRRPGTEANRGCCRNYQSKQQGTTGRGRGEAADKP